MKRRRRDPTASLVFIVLWIALCIAMLLWYRFRYGPAIQH